VHVGFGTLEKLRVDLFHDDGERLSGSVDSIKRQQPSGDVGAHDQRPQVHAPEVAADGPPAETNPKRDGIVVDGEDARRRESDHGSSGERISGEFQILYEQELLTRKRPPHRR
jgi:hypothetical protein